MGEDSTSSGGPRHGRLPWYAPEDLSAEQRAVYHTIVSGPRARGPRVTRLSDDAGRLEGPFNAMLASPGVGGAVQELGAAVRYGTALSDRVREIAILEVAAAQRSDFEWYAHDRLGREVGLTEREIAAVRDGSQPASFDPAERAVQELVRVLLHDRDVGDELYTRAREVLGDSVVYELVVLVGYYELLALSLRVFRVPLPAGEPSPFPDDHPLP